MGQDIRPKTSCKRMKIVLLQMDLAWVDPAANRKAAEGMIRENEGADIYVLPEMFTTGYCTTPEGMAEQADGETLEWMKAMAAGSGGAVAGSVAVTEEGRFFNRFYFVTPEGAYYKYDKHHLFTYAGEHHRYSAGTERVVIDYRGMKILPLVCYDLRFPVWSRNGGGQYDLAIYVASWATPRIEAWNILLRARAVENVCYVAGVNRVGSDPVAEYCGCSAVVDFKGQPVGEREAGTSGTICAQLDFDKLNEFRAKFPALQDADKFEII